MRLVKLGKIEVYYWSNDEIKVTSKWKFNHSKILVTLTAILTYCITQLQVYADPLSELKGLEKTLLDYGQGVGRLVCLVMCVFEIIKAVKNGDANAYWGIIVKYLLAYGSLHILPWAFDLIAGMFA